MDFSIEVENGSAASIALGFDNINAVTTDELHLYINTLTDLNKEVVDQERFREFWNNVATVLAMACA